MHPKNTTEANKHDVSMLEKNLNSAIQQKAFFNPCGRHNIRDFITKIQTIEKLHWDNQNSSEGCRAHFRDEKSLDSSLLYDNREGQYYEKIRNHLLFNNRIFQYVCKTDPMKFVGRATFNNCQFSGPQVKE